ncbi:MAG: isocitrate/isopropylmalate family dehydrogenase [Candidatus Polarisedimenticolia bacterium]
MNGQPEGGGKALGHLKAGRAAPPARPAPRPVRHTVTLVPGDGAGEELAEAVTRIVDASGAGIGWDRHVAGQRAMKPHGTAVPQVLLDSVVRHKAALVGRLEAPLEGGPSPSVVLRRALKVFASVRPASALPGLATRHPGLDLILVRENTEDIYAGIEHEVVPGVIESLRVVTEAASTRIAEFAFELASRQGRASITCVHKANIMKRSDGLFLECCRSVAAAHPDITYREMIADNAAMQLVRDPTRFDVILTGNMFGDILSDLCAGLLGGPGTVPSIGHGPDVVVVEAIHEESNPLALLIPAVALLRHLGESQAAGRILQGIQAALQAGRATPDLGGSAGTSEMVQAIMEAMPPSET